MAAILLLFIGLLVLYQVCKPFDWKRRVVWGAMRALPPWRYWGLAAALGCPR